jgi:hypothetical protein
MLSNVLGKESDPPDFEGCRTHYLTPDYSYCLVAHQRYECVHALPFVDGYLCTHQRHQEFAKKEHSTNRH